METGLSVRKCDKRKKLEHIQVLAKLNVRETARYTERPPDAARAGQRQCTPPNVQRQGLRRVDGTLPNILIWE